MARVSAMTAPFEAEYAVRPRGRSAEIDDTLTIAPPPALIIAGMACLATRNMVSTLTCMTRRQVSWLSSTTEPRLPMPTLLSRRSSRPKRSSAASTIALQSSGLVTSASHPIALPPSASIIATVRAASSTARSTTTTRAPALANRIAAARPLPMPSPAAPPPVTMATLPSSPQSSGTSSRDSRDHDQIGFGRGLVAKRHRHLSSHNPARRENGPQRIIGGADDSSVVAALGLGDDDLASDQLHGITLEQAQVHETLVLDSLPAAESQWWLCHAATLPGSGLVINVDSRIRRIAGREPPIRGGASTRRGRKCRPSPSPRRRG